MKTLIGLVMCLGISVGVLFADAGSNASAAGDLADATVSKGNVEIYQEGQALISLPQVKLNLETSESPLETQTGQARSTSSLLNMSAELDSGAGQEFFTPYCHVIGLSLCGGYFPLGFERTGGECDCPNGTSRCQIYRDEDTGAECYENCQ